MTLRDGHADRLEAMTDAQLGSTIRLTRERSDALHAGAQALRDLAALRVRLAQVEQGWQPIETAPKYRTVIGALIMNGHVCRVYDMRHNGLAFYTLNGGAVPSPTHWMPLPSPPALSAPGTPAAPGGASGCTCGRSVDDVLYNGHADDCPRTGLAR